MGGQKKDQACARVSASRNVVSTGVRNPRNKAGLVRSRRHHRSSLAGRRREEKENETTPLGTISLNPPNSPVRPALCPHFTDVKRSRGQRGGSEVCPREHTSRSKPFSSIGNVPTERYVHPMPSTWGAAYGKEGGCDLLVDTNESQVSLDTRW